MATAIPIFCSAFTAEFTIIADMLGMKVNTNTAVIIIMVTVVRFTRFILSSARFKLLVVRVSFLTMRVACEQSASFDEGPEETPEEDDGGTELTDEPFSISDTVPSNVSVLPQLVILVLLSLALLLKSLFSLI